MLRPVSLLPVCCCATVHNALVLVAGETRFATAFILIDRLLEVKEALRKMVVSTEWERSVHMKTCSLQVAAGFGLFSWFRVSRHVWC